jgi:hypothetical protein
MARRIVSPDPQRTKPPGATPPKGLTLADVTVTHTIGARTTTVPGLEVAQLIDATRHLHDDGEPSDFISALSIAYELDGSAEVLAALAEDDPRGRGRALEHLADVLRRLSHRAAASAPRSGPSAPERYTVEVTK